MTTQPPAQELPELSMSMFASRADYDDACLKQRIRNAGGIVHSDGNIFFTNAEQFIAASQAGRAAACYVRTDALERLKDKRLSGYGAMLNKESADGLMPLYTAPPLEVREAMSDEEIDELLDDPIMGAFEKDAPIEYDRAIFRLAEKHFTATAKGE